MTSKHNSRFKHHIFWWALTGLVVAGFFMFLFTSGAVTEVFREWWNAPSAMAKIHPNRGIETVGKLWKDGYLRFFFNYELFGCLPALGLPALIAFLVTIRRRPRWQTALVFVGSLSAVLIGAKGYYNFRYAFTLTPFIVVFILFLAWTLSKRPFVRAILLGVVCVLAIYSYRVQAERYRHYTRELSSSPKADRLPYGLIDYLNRACAQTNSRVLVMGDLWPQYYTRCRAINYDHPDVFQTLQRADEDCLTYLLKEHSIRYLSSEGESDTFLRSSSSLKGFVDLARTRTLTITDGRYSLRCIAPELTRSEIEALTRQGCNIISNGPAVNPGKN